MCRPGSVFLYVVLAVCSCASWRVAAGHGRVRHVSPPSPGPDVRLCVGRMRLGEGGERGEGGGDTQPLPGGRQREEEGAPLGRGGERGELMRPECVQGITWGELSGHTVFLSVPGPSENAPLLFSAHSPNSPSTTSSSTNTSSAPHLLQLLHHLRPVLHLPLHPPPSHTCAALMVVVSGAAVLRYL